MNGTANVNRYGKTCVKAEKAPLLLVLFAHLVLAIVKPETLRVLKCSAALLCVAVIALIAGAVGAGSVPLLIGAVAAFAFGGLGLLLTVDVA